MEFQSSIRGVALLCVLFSHHVCSDILVKKSFAITDVKRGRSDSIGNRRSRDTLSSHQLSQREIQDILDTHNNLRRQVEPSASNMQHMFWHDEMANMAQTWAEECTWDHGQPDHDMSDYDKLGQNMWKGGKNSIPVATNSWYNETYSYNFEDGSCTREFCGHYTQVVWAASSEVGCGVADCGSYNMIVCNYGPRGNYAGAKPYKTGVECSECPDPSWCYDGLCMPDCPSKQGSQACDCKIKCENCGIRHKNNCSCSCTTGWVGQFCSDECDNMDSRCGAGWYRGWCSNPDRAFVPKKCPKMCGVCEVLAESTDAKQCCGGKKCLNGGDLNAATCTCECTRNFQGDLCEKPQAKEFTSGAVSTVYHVILLLSMVLYSAYILH
ncbi:cysteine-rich venom protein latisemin-like isoform X2 [Glandiceps talaboti]